MNPHPIQGPVIPNEHDTRFVFWHTHSHSLALSHSPTLTRPLSRSHSHTHSHSHSHSPTLTHSLPLSHSPTPTPTLTHPLSHSRSLPLSLSPTLTLSHSHTHPLSLPPTLEFSLIYVTSVLYNWGIFLDHTSWILVVCESRDYISCLKFLHSPAHCCAAKDLHQESFLTGCYMSQHR